MLASVENVAGILKSLLFPVNTCFIIDYKKWKTVTDSFSKTISLLPFTTLFVRLTTRRTSLTKPEVLLSLASTFLNCNISTVNVAFVYMASFIVHMMLMTFVYIIIDVASCIVHMMLMTLLLCTFVFIIIDVASFIVHVLWWWPHRQKALLRMSWGPHRCLTCIEVSLASSNLAKSCCLDPETNWWRSISLAWHQPCKMNLNALIRTYQQVIQWKLIGK